MSQKPLTIRETPQEAEFKDLLKITGRNTEDILQPHDIAEIVQKIQNKYGNKAKEVLLQLEKYMKTKGKDALIIKYSKTYRFNGEKCPEERVNELIEDFSCIIDQLYGRRRVLPYKINFFSKNCRDPISNKVIPSQSACSYYRQSPSPSTSSRRGWMPRNSSGSSINSAGSSYTSGSSGSYASGSSGSSSSWLSKWSPRWWPKKR